MERSLRQLALVVALTGCGRFDFDRNRPADAATAIPDAQRLTYRDAVLADHPIGYWRLGDTTTTAIDETHNADGTYTGTCDQGITGALVGDANTAVNFESRCTLDLGAGFAFTGNAAFSIEVWVATDMTPTTQFVAMKESRNLMNGTPVDGYAIVINDAFLYSERVVATNNRGNEGFVLPATGWFHAVFTYDGAQLLLYGNASPSAPLDDTRALGTYTSDLFVSGYSQDVHGSVDELAVYDYALPADRVALHYAIGISGPQ